MDPLTVLIVVVIFAICLWLVNQYVPLPATVRMVVNIIVVALLLVWVLGFSGLVGRLK